MMAKVEGRAFILCNNSKQGQAILRMGQFEFERRPNIIVLNDSSVHKLEGLFNVTFILGKVPANNIKTQGQYQLFRHLLRNAQDARQCTVHWADL